MTYDETLRAYEAAVATQPGLKRKGKKIPYTSISGNMSSFLSPEGIVAIRLSTADRREFLDAYPTEPVEQYGAVMREYVAVPADLLARTGELRPWFERSCAYVELLPAKPTKRR